MLPSHREMISDRYKRFVSESAPSQRTRSLTPFVSEAPTLQHRGIDAYMRHPVNQSPPLDRGAPSGSRISFPDGEVVEISDDEDGGIDAAPGISGPQQPQDQQPQAILSNVLLQDLQSPTSTSELAEREQLYFLGNGDAIGLSDEEQANRIGAAQTTYSPMDIDNFVAPLASGLAGPSSVGLGQLPAPGTLVASHSAAPVAFNSAGQAINLTTPHQNVSLSPTDGNRPNVKRKRYVLDDFVIELTDDEDASSKSNTLSSSQELMQAQKRVKQESPLDPLPYDSPITSMPLAPLDLASSSSSPPELSPYSLQPESQIPGAWPGQYIGPGPSHLGAPPALLGVGSFPGSGLSLLASAAASFSQSLVRPINTAGDGHAEK